MIARNIIINYFGTAWTTIMSFIFIPVYIKHLGYDSYGIIGIFALLQAWLSILDASIVPLITREVARHAGVLESRYYIANLLRTVEVLFIIVSIFIVAIYYLATEIFGDLFIFSANSTNPFNLMLIISLFRFFEALYKSVLVGLQDHVSLNIIVSFFSTLRSLGAALVLIYINSSLKYFFLWQLFVSISFVIFLGIICYYRLKTNFIIGKFSCKILFEIKRFTFGVLGITLFATILTQTDKLLLSRVLSITEFGYYSLAVVLVGILGFVFSPIHQVVVPKLNKLHAEGNQIKLIETYHTASQLVSVFIGSISLFLIFNSKIILTLWTNDQHVANYLSFPLQLLVFGKLLNNFMAFPYEMQLVHGWTSLTFKMNLLFISLLVPSFIVFIPIYKINAAPMILIILNLLYIIFGISFMHKRILVEEKFRWYFHDIAKPVIFGLIPVTIVYFAKLVISSNSFDVLSLGFQAPLILCFSILGADSLKPKVDLFISKQLKKY